MAKVATTLSARGTMRTVTLTAIDVDAYIDVMGAGIDQD